MTQDQILALPLPTPEIQAKGIGIKTFDDPEAAVIALWNGVSEDGSLIWTPGALAGYRAPIVKAYSDPNSFEATQLHGNDFRVIVIGVMHEWFSLSGGYLRPPPPAWRVQPFADILAYQKELFNFAGGAHTVGG